MKKSSLIATLIGGGAIATLVAGIIAVNGPTETVTVTSEPAEQTSQAVSTNLQTSQPDSKPTLNPTSTASKVNTNPLASKLAKYPGFGHQHEQDEETFSKQERQREDLIAACMKDSGFEYTPVPSIVVDDSTLENEAEFERLLAQAAINPNQAYIDTLSPSMRESYYLMLTGMPDPNVEEGLDQTQTEASNSCVSKAFATIPGVFAKRNELKEELDALEIEIQNDQRLGATIQDWSSCMSASGHTFKRPSELQGYIDQVIVAGIEQTKDGSSDNNLASVTQLNQAMQQCMDSTNLSVINQQVRTQYENQFVETYQDRLKQ